jgi:hypothetical protein
MAPAEHYSKLAEHLRAKARNVDSPTLRAEWEHLAECYVRLAERAGQDDRRQASGDAQR